MAGMSNPKIIDRLVWEEHKGDLREVQRHWDCTWLRINVWHRAERLNAVRVMLDPSLPLIKVPGIAALRRRIEAAKEELDARWWKKLSAERSEPTHMNRPSHLPEAS